MRHWPEKSMNTLCNHVSEKPEVQTIAGLHRQFNELWQLDTDYNAFYKQLLKSTAPEFFLNSLSHIICQLPMKGLGFEAGEAFSECHRLILQDGSSFALHEALAHVFPGRFHAVRPAAVELHCTMDVLQDASIIALSSDTASEHDYRPEPESLSGDLFRTERGYLDLTYWRDLDRHGGCLIVRSTSNLNPRVIDAIGL
jgi:hypothetical protein